jgi:acyl-coenzyme A synthetase/AMP-(fatty) acid ligase
METDANLTLELDTRAHRSPDAPLLVGWGRPVSYRWMNTLVWRCAQRLHDHGVRAGHVVAVTVINPLTCALTLLAVARLGAANLPLPPSCGPEERRELAARTGARLLVTDRAGAFAAGIPELVFDLPRILAEDTPVDRSILDPRPAAPWQINRGSGSTGLPKLIPVTHAQAQGRAMLQNACLDTTPESCVASMAGFDFNMGRQALLRAVVAGARCAVLAIPGEDPLTLAVQVGATDLWLSVFHAERILELGRSADLAAIRTLRVAALAGSTVSTQLRRRLREVIGDRVWVLYGTNEASVLTFSRPPEVFETEGTVGRPPPGIVIEIVDENDVPLPTGSVGQVRVTNPLACSSYLDDDAATLRSFRDGRFYPGDLGRLTESGELIYYGRADHMMIFNGINIYPEEIERALRGHPAVADVAAVPWSSVVHQDIPVAAVALRPESTASAEELRAFARTRLGVHGPARVVLLDAIPRNEQGKLVRAELGRLLAGKAA